MSCFCHLPVLDVYYRCILKCPPPVPQATKQPLARPVPSSAAAASGRKREKLTATSSERDRHLSFCHRVLGATTRQGELVRDRERSSKCDQSELVHALDRSTSTTLGITSTVKVARQQEWLILLYTGCSFMFARS